ncbi:tRNA ligase 1 [Juglans microcarpa x Juglans regia]|uniref:tRNA ligase 1 n=1 Tax=Juglans microcarpa x Juglans regia TaxID=2249226 RepID=UPI001B7E2330|nr:tRNA ligase 1 [Juglans microcarpa x Juglans regia]
MSAPQRIVCALFTLPSYTQAFSSTFNSRTFLILRCPPPCITLACSLTFTSSFSLSPPIMPYNQRRGGHMDQRWKEKPKTDMSSSATGSASADVDETVSKRISALSITENSGQPHVTVPPMQLGSVQTANQIPAQGGQKAVWKPKSYGTVSGSPAVEVEKAPLGKMIKGDGAETAVAQITTAGLSKLFGANLLENFTVDNSTYSIAQIRATFYPKFENEKSDQEIRTRMTEMVSKGLATLEVSLKHSGSLFMYSGHEGGAYAKNSFGNIYTAVGVFVLGRMLREAWGTQAAKKQAEFNDFLERNHMCVSMELVTAVLGDHGQRPQEDYVVVTAVTELGNGKPKFFSTPEIIAFCRKWRLPTNHVWLFTTRKSVTSFFAVYDALCEEGTATSVCKTLDEVADVSVPGSKDHIKVQGEILEGLVARIVSRESSEHLEKVLEEFPPPPSEGASLDYGPNLREICSANRSDEKQQIKALLQSVGTSFCPHHSDWFVNEAGDSHSRNADRSVLSKFLQSHPADYSTTKLQEMIRLMREKRYPIAFKCYHNYHKVDYISSDNLFYKMVIHVHSDSVFRRYQKEMRLKPALWPLYRGFFIDINLFKANKERAAEIAKSNIMVENGSSSTLGKDGLADEDANLMIKLKFLTYKLRTFLIRNGLSILFKEGPAAYRAYYLRQMKTWGTSAGKQRELSKMLDEWAVFIRRKYGHKQLSQSIYLSEAEPFLEQYAKRNPQNQALIGSAGNLVRTEDFLAIVDGGVDEEGDLQMEREVTPSSPSPSVKDTVPKKEGLIIFFPGIPGCAKSALCKELLNAPGGFGDDRPISSLMGDLIKGRYWPKVADECKRKPYSIMLADKNAPNEEVWRQIEDMCRRTNASAVPVVPDSEGTDSNPFSLDALAVFMSRVLQRVNHPGNLDKASPNAGYVLLMFYNLYDGKSRKEFEGELVERFGSLVKMPLLKSDRSPLPDSVKSILEEGIDLYKLHTTRHGRLESTKGSYAKEWAKWEKELRKVLFGNAEYLNSIQVPFEFAVKQVLEELKKIAKGDYSTPDTEKRKFGNIVYAAVDLPLTEFQSVLDDLAQKDPRVKAFLKNKAMLKNLNKAHVTLAHKRSHGVTAVASYGIFLHQKVPVRLTALLFSEKMAAFEACLGSVNGETVTSRNQWPHVTIWTGEGVAAKEANALPELISEGKATQIEISPPITVFGTLEFY